LLEEKMSPILRGRSFRAAKLFLEARGPKRIVFQSRRRRKGLHWMGKTAFT